MLRTYVFSHTTSRIDVELGARLFRHLVQLPLAYFQARRVGDSVARVRELENIRSFLTGNALTVVLDVLFSVDLHRRDVLLQRAADADRAGQPAAVRGAEPGGGAGAARAGWTRSSRAAPRTRRCWSRPSPASRPSRPARSSRPSRGAGTTSWPPTSSASFKTQNLASCGARRRQPDRQAGRAPPRSGTARAW